MSTSTIRTLTEVLLKAINRLDIPKLQQLTPKDTVRIEPDPNGHPLVLNNQAEWTKYLRQTFASLQAVQDKLDSEVLDFHELLGPEVATAHMKYRQTTLLGGRLVQQWFYVSMVWQNTDEGWCNSHWHASRLQVRPV